MKHIRNILIVFLTAFVSVPGVFAAGLSFYHTDPSGTPVRMTDNTGKVVWHEVYKPFGEQQAIPTATKPNAKRFIGKELDPESGLQNVGIRYMHNGIGRFTSPDPVGAVDAMTGDTNTALLLNPQRLNAYTYGLNNPYRYIDPDGKIPIDTIWDIGNVIYDIIVWDKVSLGIDLAAMAIPYVPAGLTKLSKLGKGIDKGAVASKNTKRFSDEKQALIDMAKKDKKTGITPEDMQAYKDLNKDLTDPFPSSKVRGPEIHSDRNYKDLHGHVGPVDHIPIKDN